MPNKSDGLNFPRLHNKSDGFKFPNVRRTIIAMVFVPFSLAWEGRKTNLGYPSPLQHRFFLYQNLKPPPSIRDSSKSCLVSQSSTSRTLLDNFSLYKCVTLRSVRSSPVQPSEVFRTCVLCVHVLRSRAILHNQFPNRFSRQNQSKYEKKNFIEKKLNPEISKIQIQILE